MNINEYKQSSVIELNGKTLRNYSDPISLQLAP